MSYQLLYERNSSGQYGEEEQTTERDPDTYEETRLRKSARATRGSHRKSAGDEESSTSSGELEELCW
jgi:hypothetical protein